MVTDVYLEADDKFSSITKTKYMNAKKFNIRVDRGIKVYILGIPSCIASLFGLASLPAFCTDFGKGRVFVTVKFVIDEGTKADNETEFMDWIWFVRNHCFKADHLYLKIGDHLKSFSEPLCDSTKGLEGKVLRLKAFRQKNDELIYCTIQFVHCIELEII